ncbi:MAG TPA: carbamoyl phosphate synthase small subunit, partial [Sutterella sp.]|nr:carbamoyl phosphate synthase small subunit [Sutterella sp.]
MQKLEKGKLVLADGSVYEGRFAGQRPGVGEVVFTTGMSGYQETLTDPSFCSQIVVMTYPLVGNYGCNDMFVQGEKSFFAGYVVGELCEKPSNWRSTETLEAFLTRQNVPVLTGVDTRAITRKIRTMGAMPGVIVPADTPEADIARMLEVRTHDQVKTVSTREIYRVGSGRHK